MKKLIKDYIIITIGSVLVASGLYFFLMPNDIAAGGVNGFAMVINRYLPFLSVGLLMIIMNIILFIVAFILIGPNFGAKTIYASLALSGIIIIFEKTVPMTSTLTNDILLELVLGIMIQGVGMAIIFNENASTGGTDIIAKILNKYFHLDIGKALLLTDFTVTLLAGISFGIQKGMYSLLSVILNGLLIDKAIEDFNAHKEVIIISSKNSVIKEYIINELERGATLYYGEGAFSNNRVEILSTIVSRKEYIKLKLFIKETDKDAFIKVYDVYATFGEGFANIME